jgi:uncharacterized protein (DUF1697 family)
MTKYVALLRGISPTNPKMRNEKLRGLFQELGFTNVQTVISSGNVLFESDSKNVKILESLIEKTLPEKLGFNSTTIIHSRDDLQKIVDSQPFKELEHAQKTYLLITFFKNPPKIDLKFPYTPDGKAYKLLGYDQALYSVVDLSGAKTPDLMAWLEKQFGKEITSRTWKTTQRLLQKMQ